MDVDVHDHDVNEDVVAEALFSAELIMLHSVTSTMLRTSDGLKLVVGNHIVDVDLHCNGIMLYRTHVVLLVVGPSLLLIYKSDPEDVVSELRLQNRC